MRATKSVGPHPASPGVLSSGQPALDTVAGGGGARSTFGSLRSPSRSIAHAALLAALLVGAPGCAAASPIAGSPVPSAGLEPATAVTGAATLGGASGGLQRSCGQFMSLPSGGELLAWGALLLPVVVIVSPFLLIYAVVGTPLRVLSRRG